MRARIVTRELSKSRPMYFIRHRCLHSWLLCLTLDGPYADRMSELRSYA